MKVQRIQGKKIGKVRERDEGTLITKVIKEISTHKKEMDESNKGSKAGKVRRKRGNAEDQQGRGKSARGKQGK